MAEKTKFIGTGKRKSSIARVSLYSPGKGNIEIVSMLLEKGADVNATDCHGFTALMSARWKKHKEIVSIIKRYINRTISLVIKKGRTKDEKPLMSSAHIETIYRISSFF